MRPPDLIIDGGNGPQTLRWHLFRWRGIQVALHRWLQSDSDRALHDHSAGNISILLTGRYREWFSHAWEHTPRYRIRWPLIPYYRAGDVPHRVQLRWGPVWTLWIRFKPWKEWYFFCPQGKRHWKEYVANRDNFSGVGNGCS